MFVTYPDVAYLSGCVLVADDLGPSTRAGPRLCLLVSGVTPLRWVLRQFGGGVMLPHWRHAPSLASCSLTGVMLPYWRHALASSCVGSGDGSPTMSHVIPPRLPQTLTLHRWNCNVLSSARKMTEGNYVRLYSARSGDSAVAVFWSRRGRTLVPLQPCLRPPRWWRVVRCSVGSTWSPAFEPSNR